MSASPIEPGQGAEAAGFDWQGALTSMVIGGAAMLARLLTLERASWGFLVRSSIAAGIAAYFVGEATRHLFTPDQQGLWLATVGLAGFGSPELLQYLIKQMPGLVQLLTERLGLKGKTTRNGKGKAKTRKRRG